VIKVGLALAPVTRVQPRREGQGGLSPGALCNREPRDLDQQPLPQADFAVHGGDRVQRHAGQQPPFRPTHAGGRAGHDLRGAVCYHDCLRLALLCPGLAAYVTMKPRALLDLNRTVRYPV